MPMCSHDCASVRTLELVIELKRMLEDHMSQETEAFASLEAKLDDLIADVRALLEAERGNLSPEGQAAADALNAKLDAFDAEVGDADGSDTPPPPPVEPTPAP
jgi:hypothetical protein